MKPTCLNCGGQGWTQSPHVYDCSQCDMAETRAALEAALRADEANNGMMDWEDQLLFAYNFKMEKMMSDENTKPEPAVVAIDENALNAAGWEFIENAPQGTIGAHLWNNLKAALRPAIQLYLRKAAPVAHPLAPSGAVPVMTDACTSVELVTELRRWAGAGKGYAACMCRSAANEIERLAAQPLAGQDGRVVTEQEPAAWIRKTDITELTDSEPETEGWTPLFAAPSPVKQQDSQDQ